MAAYKIGVGTLDTDNLTKILFSSNDEYILSMDAADEYLMEQYGVDFDTLAKDTPDDVAEAANGFRERDEYYSMIDEEFDIAMDECHVLQSDKISDNKLEMVLEFSSSVSVLYVCDIKTHVLGLTAGGTDHSDSLELAYLIIDGESPFKSAQPGLTLNKRGEAALYILRMMHKMFINELTYDKLQRKVTEWLSEN